MNAEEILAHIYEDYFGSAPVDVVALAGAGSNRSYFRLSGDNSQGVSKSVIGTIGNDFEENRAFIALSRHLSSKGLPVPKVLAVGTDGMSYLQEDLGGLSLYDAIAHGRATGNFSSKEKALLVKTIRMLPGLQFKGADALDFAVCYPQESMDIQMIYRDLNYFKYDFLKPVGLEFSENRLDEELEKLSQTLMQRAENAKTFMVRDFQSRNVMLVDSTPFIIDFQGGRRGPEEYDVASFLWQARANIPASLRDILIDEYVEEAKLVSCSFDEKAFRKSLPEFVLFRMLQTLGAYGFRGCIERKPMFIKSIPVALANLSEHLATSGLADEYPYLTAIAKQLPMLPKIVETIRLSSVPAFGGLTVTIGSFSYKHGLPADLSGNGGGFVFDCRAIHNPGRYEPYKPLTGRDAAVRSFLENESDIGEFIVNVKALVDMSVDTYLRRGFQSLNVFFGCTGGRHRSVYSAEALAKHIMNKYPDVRIVLYHREQDILEIKEASA